MKLKYKALALLMNLYFCVNAQYNPVIRTGRPGQAIGAFTTGKNILQFQQGLDYYATIDQAGNPGTAISNNIIRFGIMEIFELSALVDYQADYFVVNDTLTTFNGLSNLHLGFRVHISDQKCFVPTTGFQFRLKMPDISKEYGISHVAPAVVFVANWSLPENLTLGTNWILSYNGNDQVPTGRYVVNFGFPIYKKWSGFIENFGQLRGSRFETRVDGGFAYLANNNLQFDLSAGYGDNHALKDYFISTGVSWRLSFRKTNKTTQIQ